MHDVCVISKHNVYVYIKERGNRNMENTKANYERVSKDIEKMLAKRAKAKAAIEGEITAERAKLEQRQQRKESALLEGSQAEYLKAAADATRAENSIAFLEGRKRVLTEANKIPEEFMNECKATVKAEQDRITRKALIQIKQKYEEIMKICESTIKDQEAGSDILNSLILASSEDSPGAPGKLDNYTSEFGLNYVPGIRFDAERTIKSFERYKNFMKGDETTK